MVGPTSEQLESSVCKSVTEPQQQQPQHDPVKEDISQYLLLHHDYAAKPETEPPKRQRQRKLKELWPKAKVISPPVQTLDAPQEVIYGTYDEASNSITILVNGEPTPLNEPITEVVTTVPEVIDSQLLTIPDVNSLKNPSSPSVLSETSDCGYESYDSTDVEVWDDRITELSELFPTLI